MESVRATVDEVGLDPTSTTVKSISKVSPSKTTAQVPTSLAIILRYSAILYEIL